MPHCPDALVAVRQSGRSPHDAESKAISCAGRADIKSPGGRCFRRTAVKSSFRDSDDQPVTRQHLELPSVTTSSHIQNISDFFAESKKKGRNRAANTRESTFYGEYSTFSFERQEKTQEASHPCASLFLVLQITDHASIRAAHIPCRSSWRSIRRHGVHQAGL